LIADLIQSKVDAILVETTPAALAAKRATSTVPLVVVLVADPVGSGLVANLAHPGGNLTGLSIHRANAQALYLIEAPLFLTHRAMLLKLLSSARLPMIESERRFVDEGGLISFGTNIGDLYLRSAWYVDKILKGAKPGDLPIEQPTKFELVVNLETAHALGITIPESILLRADEVVR